MHGQSDFQIGNERPLPYRGKVTLFRTLDQDSAYDLDQDLGWSAVAQGGVEVHCVPGIHATIFAAENVPYLAKEVEECIRLALIKPCLYGFKAEAGLAIVRDAVTQYVKDTKEDC